MGWRDAVAMDNPERIRIRLLRSRWLPAAAICLTLLTLASIVAYGTLTLRNRVRAGILSGDAALLHGLAQMVQVTQEANQQLGSMVEEVPDQFAIALQISQLNQFNGVIAARLFDTNGIFTMSLPGHVAEATLSADDLADLRRMIPVSRFMANARPSELFLGEPDGTSSADRAPLLEVIIPFHRQDKRVLLGAAQFVLDGSRIAGQFSTLDRSLALQAIAIFGLGAAVVIVALSWSFRRLQHANRLLFERTDRLKRANEELTLAAKTSAVGAITAHLVHGLSNPLAGLEDIVASHSLEKPGEEEWRDAAVSARGLKDMVVEILRILGEEQSLDRYEVSLEEFAELVIGRVRHAAEAAGVELETRLEIAGNLANREANLALLVVENLIRNALQASPAGSHVQFTVTGDADALRFEVSDQGAGVPPEMQSRLFFPQPSRKRGGHGVGLAISRQLAAHLGGALELAATSAQGSRFVLKLPMQCLTGEQDLDRKRRRS